VNRKVHVHVWKAGQGHIWGKFCPLLKYNSTYKFKMEFVYSDFEEWGVCGERKVFKLLN
jgi:hypothetical protein